MKGTVTVSLKELDNLRNKVEMYEKSLKEKKILKVRLGYEGIIEYYSFIEESEAIDILKEEKNSISKKCSKNFENNNSLKKEIKSLKEKNELLKDRLYDRDFTIKNICNRNLTDRILNKLPESAKNICNFPNRRDKYYDEN